MQADASRIACTDLGGWFPTPLYHGSAELAERPASMQASSPTRKKTEEKGSAVNLAVHLLNDGWLDAYDCAVVISNDSDLA